MSTLVSKSEFSNHSRSISLPTSTHPILEETEKHLRRLKSSENASTSEKLDGLRNLYECLDDELQMSGSQQFLSQEINNGTWEDEILDGSLSLLDICNTARDAYSLMKESIQELESCLRRKRGADLDNAIEAYMVSKKKLNKIIYKCFKEMKKEGKRCSMAAVADNSASQLIKQIKEAQELSLNFLQSSLTSISEPQTKGWFVVSKLLHQNKGEAEVSAIQSIEVELLRLNSKKSNKDGDFVRTQKLVKQLGALESSTQEMAQVLEAVFRLVLKGRVSLLNILNE